MSLDHAECGAVGPAQFALRHRIARIGGEDVSVQRLLVQIQLLNQLRQKRIHAVGLLDVRVVIGIHVHAVPVGAVHHRIGAVLVAKQRVQERVGDNGRDHVHVRCVAGKAQGLVVCKVAVVVHADVHRRPLVFGEFREGVLGLLRFAFRECVQEPLCQRGIHLLAFPAAAEYGHGAAAALQRLPGMFKVGDHPLRVLLQPCLHAAQEVVIFIGRNPGVVAVSLGDAGDAPEKLRAVGHRRQVIPQAHAQAVHRLCDALGIQDPFQQQFAHEFVAALQVLVQGGEAQDQVGHVVVLAHGFQGQDAVIEIAVHEAGKLPAGMLFRIQVVRQLGQKGHILGLFQCQVVFGQEDLRHAHPVHGRLHKDAPVLACDVLIGILFHLFRQGFHRNRRQASDFLCAVRGLFGFL